MCVLSFIPKPNGGFVLTNNRDENKLRPKALLPKKFFLNGQIVIYPQDPQALGTWIATSKNYTLCLLNGAFENHIAQKPYDQSRGNVILSFFKNPTQFNANFEAKAYENFTLYIIDHFNKGIKRMVWDGKELHIKDLDYNKPHLWSSATLYVPKVIEVRKKLFDKFLTKHIEPTHKEIIEFHTKTETGDIENDFIMKRPDGTHTQCITQISLQNQEVTLAYMDLVDHQTVTLAI